MTTTVGVAGVPEGEIVKHDLCCLVLTSGF